MTSRNLTESLKSEARSLGFDLVGACPAVEPAGMGRLEEWIAAGYHGEMQYLPDRIDAYRNPGHILDGVVGILMLGLNYQTVPAAEPAAGQGRVSRYAWNDMDYHELIRGKLKQLEDFATRLVPEVRVRGIVDTAPLLEREFASMAGLGWQAKNTMLINRTVGSWFFLAALLLDVPLEYDTPHHAFHCGTCRACIDACPTDAFIEPHVLDARRCISYLTIEHRDQIPLALRQPIGDWVFGCDICQEVCPWNRKAPCSETQEFQPAQGRNPLELRQLFLLTDQDFRTRFRKSPFWRSKRRGLVRNAAIVLGNHPSLDNIEPLTRGLHDPESIIRGASAWALGQHERSDAIPILEQRLQVEPVDEVAAEIRYALEQLK